MLDLFETFTTSIFATRGSLGLKKGRTIVFLLIFALKIHVSLKFDLVFFLYITVILIPTIYNFRDQSGTN